MKEFVKTMLAVIAAIIVLHLLGFLLMMFIFAGAAVSGGKTVLPREGVLDIQMSSFQIGEQSQDTSMPDFSSVVSGAAGGPVIGIWDAVRAIDKAAEDPAVKYLYLRPEGMTAGNAHCEEFRQAIVRFRESGKPVVAYMENPSIGTYYLASAADRIYLGAYHGGMSNFTGLAGQLIFVKDILDKVGVNVQLIRHGKYKSAGEMYIKNAPSAENLEQNRVMVESIWKTLSDDICAARDIDPAELDRKIDELAFVFPEDFVEAGLVDGLVNAYQLEAKLCDLAVVTSPDDLHLIAFKDYIDARLTPATLAKKKVAILFADGEIVESEATGNIDGDTFAEEVNKVIKDESIGAVVFRVNSPGGSVLASEKIRLAIDSLCAAKPVVASYGNYAASGGYWISCGVGKVYSDATTLTGSIGVFSMIPDMSKVADKVGVNFVTVGTHKHTEMMSLMHTLDKEETAYMQASVEDIYARFVDLVAEGRSMEPTAVDDIAQGRVWTGSDAIGIGLVDEIGSLKDAVSCAASLAGYESEADYGVVTFPKVPTMMEMILESMGQKKKASSILAGTPFEALGQAASRLQENEPAKVYAQLPYEIVIK